jgi:hypothetical protein
MSLCKIENFKHISRKLNLENFETLKKFIENQKALKILPADYNLEPTVPFQNVQTASSSSHQSDKKITPSSNNNLPTFANAG